MIALERGRPAARDRHRSRRELLDALIDYLDDGNEWAAERLAREPGWVLDAALRDSDSKVFAAHLDQIDGYELAQLRLGKKTERAATSRPASCTSSSTATPTARRRSASPTRTSTRHAPPAC